MSKDKNFFRISKVSLFFIIILLLFSIADAHVEEEEESHEEGINIEDYLKSTSLNYLYTASIIIIILVLISIFSKEIFEKAKWFLFLGIIIPTILATIYLAGSTIYLNLISETQGPVHWHADFEIWNCGEKIDLTNPEGFSNRIGTSVFHEHGDDRLHVEGVVIDKNEVDLHSFFNVIGAILSDNYLAIPTDKGMVEVENGDLCNGNQGKVQVFLYKVKNPEDTKNWAFEQVKLENFEDYILAPYSQVPPGDCIIIEFNQEKEKTEHMCESYKVEIERGELSGG